MLNVEHQLEEALNKRQQKNALRSLSTPSGLIDFCSNDYLGLARDKEILQTLTNPGDSIGSGGSRLISGNSLFAEHLEKELATFHGAAAGLLFNAGYVANLGLLSCLATRQDTYIYDQLIHASLRDGIRLSNAHSFAFAHNDIRQLAEKLKRAKGNKFIVIESVYSMDGDVAPLPEIVDVANKYQAALIVDEAHATGVFGPKGEGLVVQLQLEKQVFARIHTFGKAIGSHGAIVLGPETLRKYLINFSRPFIYTTAMPDALLKGIELAYQKMAKSNLIQQLNEHIKLFKSCISAEVAPHFIPSQSAIQSLVLPGNDRVKDLSTSLRKNGFDVRPILHPTVAEGQERLRICLHSFNTKEEIITLSALLNRLVREQRVISC